MSWPASDALQIELPRRLLAERLTTLLCIACGVCMELVIARYSGVPPGPGLLLAGLLLALQGAGRPRPTALRLRRGPSFAVRLAGDRWVEARAGRGMRLLGPTIVVHLEWTGGRERIWLTPLDVAYPQRRRLGMMLRQAARGFEAAGRAA